MNDQMRIAAAFRATFVAIAAVLALTCVLSLAHDEARAQPAPAIAEAYGWPI